MKTAFLHNLSDSFRTWFEHEIAQQGRGFRNVNSGQLYRVKDSNFPNKAIYSNPYGQWIFDSSVSQANVPSGVYVDGTFIPRGTSGLILDFEGGRVIFDNAVNGSVTASYAVKDFNIYSTTKTDAKLIFQEKTQFRPQFNVPVTGLPSNSVYGPMIYLKRDNITNEGFAFGGMDNSIANYRAVVLTNNDYDLDAVGSIFNDAARKNFMFLSTPPLNRYGDIVSGNSYNYLQDVQNHYVNSNLVYISDAEYYKFDSTTETSLEPNFHVGFIDFTLELPRYPRIT